MLCGKQCTSGPAVAVMRNGHLLMYVSLVLPGDSQAARMLSL